MSNARKILLTVLLSVLTFALVTAGGAGATGSVGSMLGLSANGSLAPSDSTIPMTATPTETPPSRDTPTDIATSTDTPSLTPTSTPSITRTPTITRTPSKTPTSTVTPTGTPPTPTRTPRHTITPTASPTFTPSPTGTATSTPTVHVQIPLPLILGSFPQPPILIQNGGFESGLAGWTTGGPLGVSISTSDVHSGTQSALLGSPNFPCAGGVPVGNGYVSRSILVPPTSHTLTFWYRMFTQDVETGSGGALFDSFDVYVNNLDAPNSLVYRDGNDGGAPGCNSPNPTIDLGWRQGSVDLSAYVGQHVTLYFSVENRIDHNLDSWVFLDDVALTMP